MNVWLKTGLCAWRSVVVLKNARFAGARLLIDLLSQSTVALTQGSGWAP